MTTIVTATQTFCFPPLGKPAKDADYLQGDLRPRIPQPPQKEGTCWYYALMIAGCERYGKTAQVSLQGRVNEITVSELRKKCTEATKKEPALGEQISKVESLLFFERHNGNQGILTRKYIRDSLLPKIRNYILVEYVRIDGQVSEKLKALREIQEIAEQFVQQTDVDNLEEYPDYLRNPILAEQIQIFETYLQSQHVTYDIEREKEKSRIAMAKIFTHINSNGMSSEYKEDLLKKNLRSTKGFTLDHSTRLCILHSLVVKDCYQKRGFTESSWDPSSSFDALLKNLKEHGPHVVNGFFAHTYYFVPPSKLPDADRVEGRKVYYWKKDDPHIEIDQDNCPTLSWHFITVVGGRKAANGKEYIYFINPMDESDPENIDSQKVYIMSYEKFIQNIRPLDPLSEVITQDNKGVKKRIDSNQVPTSVTGLRYAIYNTKYKPKE